MVHFRGDLVRLPINSDSREYYYFCVNENELFSELKTDLRVCRGSIGMVLGSKVERYETMYHVLFPDGPCWVSEHLLSGVD